jgi:hypothetical protein
VRGALVETVPIVAPFASRVTLDCRLSAAHCTELVNDACDNLHCPLDVSVGVEAAEGKAETAA